MPYAQTSQNFSRLPENIANPIGEADCCLLVDNCVKLVKLHDHVLTKKTKKSDKERNHCKVGMLQTSLEPSDVFQTSGHTAPLLFTT